MGTDLKVIPFLFEGDGLVRVATCENAPRFVASDVCSILAIENVSKAVEKLDGDEKGITSIHTLGGPQEVLIVSEGGLYTIGPVDPHPLRYAALVACIPERSGSHL